MKNATHTAQKNIITIPTEVFNSLISLKKSNDDYFFDGNNFHGNIAFDCSHLNYRLSFFTEFDNHIEVETCGVFVDRIFQELDITTHQKMQLIKILDSRISELKKEKQNEHEPEHPSIAGAIYGSNY